jgi:hypothetical protein
MRQSGQSKRSRPIRTGSRCTAILLAITLLPFASASAADRYEGLAYASDSGELAYRETHWRYRDQGRPARLVLYRCPDGTPFARKHLHGAADAIAPRFAFVDARDGYREGLRDGNGDGARREVYWQPRRQAKAQARTLEIGANVVADAGFDALVRARWDELHAGMPVEAAFLVPSRLDTVEVSIRKVDAAADPGQLHLRMKLDAWYGFAAPRIDLVYRGSDRRLLRFEGIGTIRDDRGRHRQVRIEFPPRLRVDEVARAQVDAAAALPLSRGCDD